MSFPKLVNMAKNTPFFPILHVFVPLNDVRAYIALSWKTTLITWIFLRGWYPTSNTSGPPGVGCTYLEKGQGFFPAELGKSPRHQQKLTPPHPVLVPIFLTRASPPTWQWWYMIYEEWLPSEDCNFRRNPVFDGRIDGIFDYFWTSEWSNLTTRVLDCVQIFRKANESRFPVSRYPTPPGNKCWPNNSLFWIKFWFLKNFSIKSNIFVLDISHILFWWFSRIFLAVGVWYMVIMNL